MARNATLKAPAKEDCFTSTSGLPWLAANDMMHLPVPTMRQHIEDAYMKPCGPYRACDNCPPSPASLKVFVAQGTCNSDTPDPPVWLVVSGIRDNRAGPEQPTYHLDYEICPASERSHFVRICKRIALRLAASALPQEDGLSLPS